MRVAFYVATGALALALIGGALPLLDCPVCVPPDVWSSGLLACPACRDRGETSLFKRLTRRPLHPILSMIVSARGTSSRWVAIDLLLGKNDLKGVGSFQRGEVRLGFPLVREGFVESDAGLRYLLIYSGHRGMFSWRHPHPFPARLLLFDEEARLLDQWELATGDERRSVHVDDGPVAIVAELIPRLGEELPGDAAMELVVEGQPVRRLGTSVRIDPRAGRLAVAP